MDWFAEDTVKIAMRNAVKSLAEAKTGAPQHL
jgi:hypothetical protein